MVLAPSREVRAVMMPGANLCFPSCSSPRLCAQARHPTRTSCEPCGAAGRRTSACCAPTQPWLLTTTTRSWTAVPAGRNLHTRTATAWCVRDKSIFPTCSSCTSSSGLSCFKSFSRFSFLFSTPRCCLASASAAKFQDAVLRAGLVPQLPPEITALTAMETRSTALQRGEDWARVLRERIAAVVRRWEARRDGSVPPGLQGGGGQVVTQG